MKKISVLWLCTCQERPVGVVKAWGQKVDSLRFLQAFAGEAEAHGLGTAAGTDEPV